MEIFNRSIRKTVKLIRNGKLSPIDLSQMCSKRIEETRSLNAYISVINSTTDYQEKNKKEEQLLYGIPFSVKDNFSTRNVATTCGSVMLRNYVPTYNATLIEKLNHSGALLQGKTNMDEFAMGSGSVDSVFGPVRNPWKYDWGNPDSDEFHIAGGSSGGSAVAVATGASFFALGSDTGGSVRIPASFVGVCGLKPSYGSLSRHGLISLVNSQDVPGIFARCVDDIALVYNVVKGQDSKDSTTVPCPGGDIELNEEESVTKLVIGIPDEYHGPGLCKEILDIWNWVAGILDNAGAKVVRVKLPNTQYSIKCYHVLSCGEIASNMARYDGLQYGHRSEGRFTEELYAQSRNEGFNETVRSRIVAGNYFLLNENFKEYYENALKIRRLVSNDFNEVFHKLSLQNSCGVDVLLTPTTVSTAPLYKDFISKSNRRRTAEHDIYTQAANLAGVPAISIPIKLSYSSLPISLQLMAPMFEEEKLLKVAKFIENTVNFSLSIFTNK